MWSIDSATAIATLEISGLTGTVDLADPAGGFRPSLLQGTPSVACKSLLAIDLGQFKARGDRMRPSECFVRGHDLIATYPESDRSIRSQIYWRAIPSTTSAPEFGIEVMVSRQTELLDSDPRFVARTELTADQLGLFSEAPSWRFQPFQWDASADVKEWRPSPVALWGTSADPSLGYLEIPFRGDTAATRLVRLRPVGGGQPVVRIEHDVLQEFLEKGVIRRCRLRGLFLPSPLSDALASDAVERFRNAELPLTA